MWKSFVTQVSGEEMLVRTWDSDLCGSAGWVLFCRAKGHWFHSRLGHVPGLWVRSLVGG